MSVGTTADHALTRNQIIAHALRKCRGWPEDGNPPVHKLREAIQALNNLVRTEDLKQTDLSKSLWALAVVYLPLVAGRYIFSENEDLPLIRELVTVLVRGTDGDDSAPLRIVTPEEYNQLNTKNETGDPERVYLKRTRLLEDQQLILWPAPSSVTAGDTVWQGGTEYTCVLGHTSASENKPGSGASWQLFWQAGDVDGTQADTWVTATAYDNGDLLVVNYKRPLYDFDSPYDNPDFPLGWEDYFIYKLAIRLAPEYDLGMDRRQELKNDLAQIMADIFPSTRPNTNTYHNKGSFF